MSEKQPFKSRPDEENPTRERAFNNVQISPHFDRVSGYDAVFGEKWQLFCFELRFETRNCRAGFSTNFGQLKNVLYIQI